MSLRKIKNIELPKLILALLFVLALAGVFHLHSVNISVLILVFFFAYYIKGLRKKVEPDYLSLCFLFTLGLTSLILSKAMELDWYAAPVIALAILINVLYMDLEFSFAYLFLICIFLIFLSHMVLIGFS